MSKAFDISDRDIVSVYDECALWSAPFGLELLRRVRYRRGMAILDIGCGAGFPLIEIAQRCGPDSRAHGLDPWQARLARTSEQCAILGVGNVTLHEGVAEEMPF